ncbi:hypothetical protein AVEN_122755-1 [Araneus ventricosus]|uniref:Uncharacterized protein n=1 Tax=Araneus ventricosus TaxID=182803 RepID=A0A4Y2MSM5_ARAVE|nr:hypothetical protein AVEN_122755-1 [Araneus ventricosus]
MEPACQLSALLCLWESDDRTGISSGASSWEQDWDYRVDGQTPPSQTSAADFFVEFAVCNAHQFSCEYSLLEFGPARRSTVTPTHRLLLGFRGKVNNPRLITHNDPVEELIALIVVLLQKSQCCSHAYGFIFRFKVLRHPYSTQFLEQQAFCDDFMHQRSQYSQKMATEFCKRKVTVLQNALPHLLHVGI